ncbi:transcription termination factor, mitochondrial isoform X2 [Pieris rapae]|uniref:transcription termination factor, mitochondrial isoform X2 n=1 Tax=Pieris rapae TaxID=64459 RepID=UPI001E27B17E|nr:transcription termination factor, mitochondrial isoform X2 [Pieris rapae]
MAISAIYFNITKSNYAQLFKTTLCLAIPNVHATRTIISSTYILQKKLSINNTIGSTLDSAKKNLISEMKFESESHAAPFCKLPIKSLLLIYKTTKQDQESGCCNNRLYYIASHLKCPPGMLSDRLAKRCFIYSLSFDWLEKSLKVLLDKGVSPDRILRDLWVLKYHHQTIEDRLKRIQDLGIDTLYPWMVRCSEDILNRYIEIYQETKSILGNGLSTKGYIANRLNTSIDTIDEIYAKVPAFTRIRVSKVKKFLDFLFEEGFTIEDILCKPRVLCASQKTVKERLEILRGLGLKDINLNVLCRSRKDFRKYYESLLTVTKDEKKQS